MGYLLRLFLIVFCVHFYSALFSIPTEQISLQDLTNFSDTTISRFSIGDHIIPLVVSRMWPFGVVSTFLAVRVVHASIASFCFAYLMARVRSTKQFHDTILHIAVALYVFSAGTFAAVSGPSSGYLAMISVTLGHAAWLNTAPVMFATCAAMSTLMSGPATGVVFIALAIFKPDVIARHPVQAFITVVSVAVAHLSVGAALSQLGMLRPVAWSRPTLDTIFSATRQYPAAVPALLAPLSRVTLHRRMPRILVATPLYLLLAPLTGSPLSAVAGTMPLVAAYGIYSTLAPLDRVLARVELMMGRPARRGKHRGIGLTVAESRGLAAAIIIAMAVAGVLVTARHWTASSAPYLQTLAATRAGVGSGVCTLAPPDALFDKLVPGVIEGEGPSCDWVVCSPGPIDGYKVVRKGRVLDPETPAWTRHWWVPGGDGALWRPCWLMRRA